MGNNNNIDFKDYTTKEELKSFLNKVEFETIKQQAEEIRTEMKSKQPRTQLDTFVENYFDAECKCDAPSFVFWLSQKKRQECQTAKMKAFGSFMSLADSSVDYNQLSLACNKLDKQATKLTSIIETNKNLIL